MPLYLIAYDIAHDRRRRRVAKLLAGVGRRIQESLFEARLDCDQIAELRERLGPHLKAVDLLEIAPIDERSEGSRVRWFRAIGIKDQVRVR